VTARRAKRENGGLGEDPPGSTMDSLTGPSNLQVQSSSAPSEARKWGSGGGSPKKYDDSLTGPSDLQVQRAARRAKRENGGLGEDPQEIR
jgi:hypothetical protein